MARTIANVPGLTIPGRRASLITAGVATFVVVAGLAIGSTRYMGGDRIAPGVVAAGVSLTGRTSEEALPVVSERLAMVSQVRARIHVRGSDWDPTFSDLGLSMEPNAVVSQLVSHGRTGSIGDRVASLGWSFIRSVEVAVPTVNRTRLESWIAGIANQVDRLPRDAVFSIASNGEATVLPEMSGTRVDQAQSANLIAPAITDWTRNWMAGQRLQSVDITLPVVIVAPTFVSADFQSVLDDARRITNRPVTVRNDRITLPIVQADVAGLIAARTVDGKSQVTVSEVAIDRLIDRLAPSLERTPVRATIAIRPDARIEASADVPGWKLDRLVAKQVLMNALLTASEAPVVVSLPGQTIDAPIREADLAPLRAEIERALGSPIMFTLGDQSLTFKTVDISPLLSLSTNADGRPSLRIDTAPLKDRVAAFAKEVERSPRNGRLQLAGGSGTLPTFVVASMPGGGEGSTLGAIEEGINGRRLDVDKTLGFIAERIANADRRGALSFETLPAITSADRAVFGPMELIDAGTTTYAGGIPERTHNVELAASRLNGAIVPPGQMYSFNRALGATTTENGYQTAWGITSSTDPKSSSPKTVPSVGGGICQVATTLFHAVFWSGYQLEERNWHLYWIPKYGVGPRGLQGLDATVDEEFGVDFQWLNTTGTPVLIQARTDGSRISFALFGKKPDWKVEVTPPVIDKTVPAPTGIFRQMEPTMPVGKTLMIEEARDGFRSTIIRTVTAPNAEPRVLKLASLYQPARNVLLVGGVAAPASSSGNQTAPMNATQSSANGAGTTPVPAAKPAATAVPAANAPTGPAVASPAATAVVPKAVPASAPAKPAANSLPAPASNASPGIARIR